MENNPIIPEIDAAPEEVAEVAPTAEEAPVVPEAPAAEEAVATPEEASAVETDPSVETDPVVEEVATSSVTPELLLLAAKKKGSDLGEISFLASVFSLFLWWIPVIGIQLMLTGLIAAIVTIARKRIVAGITDLIISIFVIWNWGEATVMCFGDVIKFLMLGEEFSEIMRILFKEFIRTLF
ncbi:MAG: hypothetical protein LBL82_00055 [Oscillospiraceae bacterium]|jgi:hypothetical protein|nr:hypothetical protein [Oscillospiraceae bacterium]